MNLRPASPLRTINSNIKIRKVSIGENLSRKMIYILIGTEKYTLYKLCRVNNAYVWEDLFRTGYRAYCAGSFEHQMLQGREYAYVMNKEGLLSFIYVYNTSTKENILNRINHLLVERTV